MFRAALVLTAALLMSYLTIARWVVFPSAPRARRLLWAVMLLVAGGLGVLIVWKWTTVPWLDVLISLGVTCLLFLVDARLSRQQRRAFLRGVTRAVEAKRRVEK